MSAFRDYDAWRTSPPEDDIPDTVSMGACFDVAEGTLEPKCEIDTGNGEILSATINGREVSRETLVAVFGEPLIAAQEKRLLDMMPEAIRQADEAEWSDRGDWEYERRRDAAE